MKLVKGDIRRAAVYVFFDREGIVDQYVEYFLGELLKVVQMLVVVSNGKLLPESRKKLERYTCHVFARDNKGYDTAAYKAGMEYIGWNNLQKYDELVLLNDTIYGPVYPLNEMFDTMDEKDVDFWGITRHYKVDINPFKCVYGYIPEHIQSYFMAFRKDLLCSYEFVQYWMNLPSIKSYEDAVGKHEVRFTKYFADKGFKWDTYVDTDDLKDKSTQPLMVYEKELIEHRRCPVFKRRLFFQGYDWFIENSVGEGPIETYEYVRDYTSYDVNMVLDNLLRVYNQADFAKCLHFNYILPSDISDEEKTKNILTRCRVALIMYIHCFDQVEEMYRYASSMPENSDIYLIIENDEIKETISQVFDELKWNHLEIIIGKKDGENDNHLLTKIKGVLRQHELICFVNGYIEIKNSCDDSFKYKCLQNVLYNNHFVNNVLKTFADNPRLGILSPPVPSHGEYFSRVGNEWGDDFVEVSELAGRMNLHVKIEKEKEYLSPAGNCFWFRPKALERLFHADLDGSSIENNQWHIIEKIISFVAQEGGFYSGRLMVDQYARVEYTNLWYQLRGFNKAIKINDLRTTTLGAHTYVEKMFGEKGEYAHAIEIIKYNEGQIESWKREFDHAVEIIKYNEDQIENWKKEYAHAIEIIKYNENIIENQKQLINQIYNSNSWKWTAPIRKLKNLLKGEHF